MNNQNDFTCKIPTANPVFDESTLEQIKTLFWEFNTFIKRASPHIEAGALALNESFEHIRPQLEAGILAFNKSVKHMQTQSMANPELIELLTRMNQMLVKVVPFIEQILKDISKEIYPVVISINDLISNIPTKLQELSLKNPPEYNKITKTINNIYDAIPPEDIENSDKIASPETIEFVSETIKHLTEEFNNKSKEIKSPLSLILAIWEDIKEQSPAKQYELFLLTMAVLIAILK